MPSKIVAKDRVGAHVQFEVNRGRSKIVVTKQGEDEYLIVSSD